MIDFDKAREIAYKVTEPEWPKNNGTLFASMEGREDRTHWLVVLGAEEWIIDEDPDYITMDAPYVLVNKQTGKATSTTYLDNPDRFDRMRVVNVG